MAASRLLSEPRLVRPCVSGRLACPEGRAVAGDPASPTCHAAFRSWQARCRRRCLQHGLGQLRAAHRRCFVTPKFAVARGHRALSWSAPFSCVADLMRHASFNARLMIAGQSQQSCCGAWCGPPNRTPRIRRGRPGEGALAARPARWVSGLFTRYAVLLFRRG